MNKASLIFFLWFSAWPSQAKIINMTLAQVQSHVITQREVKIHQMVDKVLGRSVQVSGADRPVESVIREWLLFYEASTFYSTSLSSTKVSQQLQIAKNKLNSSRLWKDLQVTSKELKAKVSRRLQAERLFQFKKKASVLPVSRSELETEYTQNRLQYGNLSFKEVESQIRRNRVQENLNRRLQQWFAVLENKYKVQRFSQADMK